MGEGRCQIRKWAGSANGSWDEDGKPSHCSHRGQCGTYRVAGIVEYTSIVVYWSRV